MASVRPYLVTTALNRIRQAATAPRRVARFAATVPGRLRDWRTPPSEPDPESLQVRIDEFTHFRDRVYVSGLLWHAEQAIVRLDYRFPGRHSRSLRTFNLASPDAVDEHGQRAGRSRFHASLWEQDPWIVQGLTLIATLEDGHRESVASLPSRSLRADPVHRVFERFCAALPMLPAGGFLEIGSRNRSGNVRNQHVPASMTYTGFDVAAGPNVDVVGDAHHLADHFAPGTFQACLSISTFEHLAMPWRAVVELNRVLSPGALVLITTHQTWPMHEEPWDFWRFSAHAWSSLFNTRTGFEIIESAMGEPAIILGKVVHPILINLPHAPAYLASAVLARKIGDATVVWSASPHEFLTTSYPA